MELTTKRFIVKLSDLRQDVAFFQNHKDMVNEEFSNDMIAKLTRLQKVYPATYNYVKLLAIHWGDDAEPRLTVKVLNELSKYLLGRIDGATLQIKRFAGCKWSVIENLALN